MSVYIPLLQVYFFMAWTRKTLLLKLLHDKYRPTLLSERAPEYTMTVTFTSG